MQPIVHELEQTYGEDIELVLFNIDDPDTRAAQQMYGFRVQPHFILVDANGDVINQWLGYQSPNVFEEAFLELLAN